MPLIIGTTTTEHGKLVPYEDSWEFEPDLEKYIIEKSGIQKENWLYTEQTHSNKVTVIKEKPLPSLPIPETDALITNIPNTLLLTKHADCIPIFYHDSVKNVVGLAHSGFKGTVSKIAQSVIEEMKSQYNSNPIDIKITIGPGASKCCYTFTDTTIFDNKPDWQPYVIKSRGWTYLIDMPGYIVQTLTENGILEENITNQQICTIHNGDYFSWRYNKAQGKRLELGISYIGIKS